MAELTEEQKAPKFASEEAAKLAARKSAKNKYEVLRPLNHSHDLYPVGSYVKLTDDEAEEHLLHQVIKPATKEVAL